MVTGRVAAVSGARRPGGILRTGCLATSLAVLAGLASGTEAAEIRVFSAGAMKTMITELAEAFRQETGHTVLITAGTVGALRQKAAAGEPADVFILSDVAIDDLSRQGLVVPGTRTDLARTAIGVGVKEGAPRPDISTPEALKQTLLAVKSFVYIDPASGGTSGIHFAGVLQRLGIADAVKDKALLWPGGLAAEAVVKGQAELVVHQISEILPVKGVTLVGPLPKELQKVTTYSAGLAAKSAMSDVARTFIAYLARPVLRPKFEAAGLDYRE
jgi:molybdate transport system substrate-binding protein